MDFGGFLRCQRGFSVAIGFILWMPSEVIKVVYHSDTICCIRKNVAHDVYMGFL